MLAMHQMDLGCLWVTCHLFYMLGSSFITFHFLCKLSQFTCRKLVEVNVAIIDGFLNKFLISQEEPKYISMQKLGSFLWVLG